MSYLMRMEVLLNDILDFGKPLELDRRTCRVTVLIEEALDAMAADLKMSRIEVVKEFPARLGQVRWDQEKIRHAFLSIFTNALEAMASGGNLRISVSQKRGRQPEMVIRIHNDGIPIPEELSEKIFEPYFTTKRSGTGLGPGDGEKNRGGTWRALLPSTVARRKGRWSPSRCRPCVLGDPIGGGADRHAGDKTNADGPGKPINGLVLDTS